MMARQVQAGADGITLILAWRVAPWVEGAKRSAVGKYCVAVLWG